jgi:catechol 2,3-dioxygenase-like lactoylglutathione lyase family enzyme
VITPGTSWFVPAEIGIPSRGPRAAPELPVMYADAADRRDLADAAAVEARLQPQLGQRLCVVPSRWTKHDIDEVRGHLRRHWEDCTAQPVSAENELAAYSGGYSRVDRDELMTWRDYSRGEIVGHRLPCVCCWAFGASHPGPTPPRSPAANQCCGSCSAERRIGAGRDGEVARAPRVQNDQICITRGVFGFLSGRHAARGGLPLRPGGYLTVAVPAAQLVCLSPDFRETGRVLEHVHLDHVVIAVSDWDRPIRFYRDVMGAQVVDHPDGRVAFRFGNQQLNVHGPGVDAGTLVASPPVAPGGSDLCFAWPGTPDALARHLAARSVAAEDGPVVRYGGAGAGTSTYFRDPDGSLLEYIVYPGTKPR